MTEEAVKKIRNHFANTSANDVYLCHDGRIIDGDVFRHACNSRESSLVAIADVGFPMNISRKYAFKLWLRWRSSASNPPA